MRHTLAALALTVVTATLTACSEPTPAPTPTTPTPATTPTTSTTPTTPTPPTPPTTPPTPTPPTLPPAGPVFGSCNIGGLSCSDYSGAPSPLPKDLCGKVGGTWSASPCPTGGVVGTCASVSGGMPIATHSYAPGTAATSKKACDGTPGGVFIAR
jgi:hypothetical protein